MASDRRHVVAAFPGLILYAQPHETHEDAFLVIGLIPEIRPAPGPYRLPNELWRRWRWICSTN
jgi:hypothetical protein